MDKKSRVSSGGTKVLLGLVVVIVFLVVAFIASNLSYLNYHKDRFSFNVRNYDKEGAEQELATLKKEYSYFSSWGLRYFEDKYIFQDMFLYEAEVDVLAEDWGKAIKDLKDHQDNPLALDITGISKFMVIYAEYQEDKARGGHNSKEIIDKVVKQVNPDFEKAVKLGPGPAKAFDYSWNYDLTSDKDTVKQAMEAQIPKPKFVLGIPDKNGPPMGGNGKKDKPFDSIDDKQKDAGSGTTKRRG